MNLKSAERAGTAGGVLAGLAALLAWPLCVIGLAFAGREPMSAISELGLLATSVENLKEGGPGSLFVLISGALATVAGAVLLFLGTTRGRSAMLLLAPVAGLPALVGAVYAWHVVSQAADGVMQVPPDDRMLSIWSPTAMGVWATSFGVMVTSALMLAGGLGGFIGALFRRGRGGFPLWAASFLLFALSIIHLSAVVRLRDVARVFESVLHSSPRDRPNILAIGIADSMAPLVLVAGLVAFGMALVVGVLATRRTPASMRLFLLFAVAGWLGMASVVLGRRASSSLAHERFATQGGKPVLLTFEAPPVTDRPRLTVTAGGVWRAPEPGKDAEGRALTTEELRDILTESASSDERSLSVGVGEDASPAALYGLLSRAVQAGVRNVELVGRWPGDLSGTAAELQPLAAITREFPPGVAVTVDTADARCPGRATSPPSVRLASLWPACRKRGPFS
jgi:hypothetical protein